MRKKKRLNLGDIDMTVLSLLRVIYNTVARDMSINPEIKKYIDKTIEKKIKEIKKGILLTTEESLYELWDNEYDERWDKC